MRPIRSTLFWNRVLGGMHVSRLLRDGVGTFVLKGVNAGFTFLSTVLLARLLGAEGYGLYAYALALVTLVGTPVHTGLPILVVRQTASGMASGQYNLVRGAWLWTTKVTLVLSAGLMMVAGLIALLSAGSIGPTVYELVTLGLPLIPLVALGTMVCTL